MDPYTRVKGFSVDTRWTAGHFMTRRSDSDRYAAAPEPPPEFAEFTLPFVGWMTVENDVKPVFLFGSRSLYTESDISRRVARHLASKAGLKFQNGEPDTWSYTVYLVRLAVAPLTAERAA